MNMIAKNEVNEVSGFIIVNKPAGITSYGVVKRLKKVTGIKKIGHAGTLDPMAVGLLILGIGRKATKKLKDFLKSDKEYLAVLRLGAVSDTYDCQGEVKEQDIEKIPSLSEIRRVLSKFVGLKEQIPPVFSAKKIGGERLYKLARRGIIVKPKPQKIKIYKITILGYSWPELKIKVFCSSGTYIRSLANDIGKELGCGAYLSELCRTKIDGISLDLAVDLGKIQPENWQKFLVKEQK